MNKLDLNTDPINGDVLRTWRKAQTRQGSSAYGEAYRQPCPSQKDLSREVGLSEDCWGRWERKGVPAGPQAAIVRLIMEEAVAFDGTRHVRSHQVTALAQLVGGREALARELGVQESTIDRWCRQGVRNLAGQLVHYLVHFLGLI